MRENSISKVSDDAHLVVIVVIETTVHSSILSAFITTTKIDNISFWSNQVKRHKL